MGIDAVERVRKWRIKDGSRISVHGFYDSYRNPLDRLQSRYCYKVRHYHQSIEGVELSLDLHFSKQRAIPPQPAVLLIHGGWWKQGNKEDIERVAMMLAKHGYIAASTSYRFALDWPFPAQLEDVQTAVRWVHRHADEYNIGTTKIGGLGISARAHLVSLLGVVDSTNLKDQISSKIQCVVDPTGPTNLQLLIYLDQLGDSPDAAQVEDRLLDFMGIPYNKSTDSQWIDASPRFHISDDDPPFFIIHDAEDQLVSIPQSKDFAQASREEGIEVDLRIIKGLEHSLDTNFIILYRFWRSVQTSFKFLDKHLKS